MKVSSMPGIDPNAVAIRPSFEALGKRNCILNGRGRSYLVRDYPGPLSIKYVISGSATYETEDGRYRLHPDCFLVLNRGRRYSMFIDSPTETFCLFFRDGFAEEAARTTQNSAFHLLDNPVAARRPATEFIESLQGDPSSKLVAVLRAMHWRVHNGQSNQASLIDSFFCVADLLAGSQQRARAELAAIPAIGAATRLELYRRLSRAKSFLDDTYATAPSLEDAARVACLSVHHFHRTFSAVFQQTPHQYVTMRRIEKAKQLLLTGEAPLGVVCGELAFESVPSFCALFKRCTGLSPAAFRALRKKARFENVAPGLRATLLAEKISP
jgi:AraC-like DNA-binding protein